jgi:hypothetical protein
MRTLVAFLLLLLGVGAAHAESRIHLSCSRGHAVKRTMFEDGHVRTAKEEAAPFAIDVDLEHKMINGFYDTPHGQQFENGSVTIGGIASKLSSDHEPGYQDTISIDRLSGTAIVTHRDQPADDCADGAGRACLTSETTTIYHCLPAEPGFPTPLPRMLRAWERFRHSFTLARMRRVLHRVHMSIERRIAPEADQ